jgi:hypothetical protein
MKKALIECLLRLKVSGNRIRAQNLQVMSVTDLMIKDMMIDTMNPCLGGHWSYPQQACVRPLSLPNVRNGFPASFWSELEVNAKLVTGKQETGSTNCLFLVVEEKRILCRFGNRTFELALLIEHRFFNQIQGHHLSGAQRLNAGCRHHHGYIAIPGRGAVERLAALK